MDTLTVTSASLTGPDSDERGPAWQVVPLGAAPGGDAPAVALIEAAGPPHPRVPAMSFHEWLEGRWLARGRRAAERATALDFGEYAFSFADLMDRADQLANYLWQSGVRSGDVVAVKLERSLDLYAVQLGISKVGATYLPLDLGFPADRVTFMLADARAHTLVTTRTLAPLSPPEGVAVVELDELHDDIGRAPRRDRDVPVQECGAAYLIYTSGTTGQPKAVVVSHANIVNFLTVAARSYGYAPGDRVLQGLSPAFDFAVEDTWVPLASGATLVPAPSGSTLVGVDLSDFLVERQVTALCCVPTLLATIPAVLPDIRLLLVSGEACPADVVDPWLDGRRRVLNLYGPTETTVTATWSVMQRGARVTIGGPLPSYAVVIAEPGSPRALPRGAVGEIVLAGPGVTEGYLGRPDQTVGAFVADFAGVTSGGGRLYRTGDLGRITEDHQIEFLGRIDTQVKISGYRIELGEIESLIRSLPGVANAAVQPFEDGSTPTLVAYLVPSSGEEIDVAEVDAVLRAALPPYMLPAHYEHLDRLPVLTNSKVDRSALPAPVTPRWSRATAPFVAPDTETEATLAAVLGSVLGLEEVSVEADFFDELGANSLSMAAYITEIRKTTDVRRLSMKLLYQNTTVRALSGRVDELRAAAAARPVSTPTTARTATTTVVPDHSRPGTSTRPPVSRIQHVAFAVAQAGVLVVASFVAVLAAVVADRWVGDATGVVATYGRAVAAGTGLFAGSAAGLVGLKWLLVGRFRSVTIDLWGLGHLRLWAARLAIRTNPMNVFRGSPLYNVFLRSLGVRVGPRAVVLAPPPVCTDLVSVGADTLIRRSSQLLGYKAEGRVIRTGPIRIGERAVVGEATYLDIDSAIGDDAQLGTTSALLEGQRVPSGSVYQGSPAEPSEADFCQVDARVVTPARRLGYAAGSLAWSVLAGLPAVVLLGALAVDIDASTAWTSGVAGGLARLGLVAAVVYFGSLAAAFAVVLVVPRVLHRFVVPDVAHPLYGFQHMLATGIARISNNKLLNTIFGDSSMILGYLRLVGYDLRSSTQTGSNFGVDQQHDSPFLCSFDRNTLVSDGLRLLNTETSATSFVTRRIAMPPDTYLGNDVFYPTNAAVGDNCLIATKAAIPTMGTPRTNVGILGSPPFEIPRSVRRDQQFDHYKQPGVIEGRLRLKLRSNLVTLAMYLGRSWLITWIALVLPVAALAGVPRGSLWLTASALTAATIGSLLAATLVSILLERLVLGFRPLAPRICSLYERAFWDHERFWKLNYNAFLKVFDGTPMKPLLLRLQGAQVGVQVLDDGAGLTEPSLVRVGDYCTLSFGATIQAHSLEDGTFKSDRIHIGDHCTVGSTALVHYGTRLQDASILEPDSFLMKGSEMEAGSTWSGNPARPTSTTRPLVAAPYADHAGAREGNLR